MKDITSRPHPFQRMTEADRWEVTQSEPEINGELVIQVPAPLERLQRWKAWWQWGKRFSNWLNGFILAIRHS